MRQRLSTVYGTLHSICGLSLRNRLETEPEHQEMVKSKRYCAMKLLNLVKKIYNGSTYVIVGDAVGNLIESLYNVMLIRGDDFKSLPKCLEASEHRHSALVGAGFDIVNPKFRDSYMEELVNRGQDLSKACLALKGWKEAEDGRVKQEAEDRKMDREIAAGKKVLTDVFRARLCIR